MYKIPILLLFGLGMAMTNAAVPLQQYVIALSETHIPAEQTAAEELQLHLKKLSGFQLPIVVTDAPSGPAIRLGQSAAIGVALGIDNFSELHPDEIILQTKGDDLIVSGCRPRGTLYAVYSLLEEHLGVHFWSATETGYPEQLLTALPPLSIRYIPPFAIREPFMTDSVYGGERFAAISRNNGHWSPVSEVYGGKSSTLGFCHTFARILPPDELLGSHPEWFSMVNGQRCGSQLCLSNPEMRLEFIRRAKKWLMEHPESMFISISQNDTEAGFCECPECRTLTTREQGRQSGVLLDFVNEVAAALETVRPGITVGTLAYNYTQEPPLVTMPRSNVMIRLCVIGASFNFPLTADRNAAFRRNLEAWATVAHHISVWYYLANFSNFLLPFPTWENWDEDLRLFRDHSVDSVFAQGDTLSGGGGDFVALRNYVIRRLLWNPDLKATQLEREFIAGYYGNAAQAISHYLAILRRPLMKAQFFSCYQGNTDNWLPIEDLLAAYHCMEEATRAAMTDPLISERVRRLRTAPLCALLLRPEIVTTPEKSGFSAAQLQQMAMELFAIGNELPIPYYSEVNKFPALEAQLRVQYRLQEAARPEEIPDFLQSVDRKKITVLRHPSFRVYQENTNVFDVSDPVAVAGKAWRLAPTSTGWLIQHELPESEKPVRVFAAFRVEGDAKAAGPCLLAGIQQKEVSRPWRTLSAQELPGAKYHYVDLGEYHLKAGAYFYCAAIPNPAVTNIYVDQVLLVQEGKKL